MANMGRFRLRPPAERHELPTSSPWGLDHAQPREAVPPARVDLDLGPFRESFWHLRRRKILYT
jgi:hypothetical protein